MTQPITPYTTLQMTLEVERQQHIKHMQHGQEQGALAQQLDQEKELKQKQVNANEKTEQEKVRDEDENGHRQESHSQNEDENDDQETEPKKGQKGKIIDVKI